MITNENKKRILEAIATNRTNYPCQARCFIGHQHLGI